MYCFQSHETNQDPQFCVCACMYAYMCECRCSRYMNGCQRINECQFSLSILSEMILFTAATLRLAPPPASRDYCLCFPSLRGNAGITNMSYCIWLYVGVGDLNLGPFTCVASSLSTEPLPPSPLGSYQLEYRYIHYWCMFLHWSSSSMSFLSLFLDLLPLSCPYHDHMCTTEQTPLASVPDP